MRRFARKCDRGTRIRGRFARSVFGGLASTRITSIRVTGSASEIARLVPVNIRAVVVSKTHRRCWWWHPRCWRSHRRRRGRAWRRGQHRQPAKRRKWGGSTVSVRCRSIARSAKIQHSGGLFFFPSDASSRAERHRRARDARKRQRSRSDCAKPAFAFEPRVAPRVGPAFDVGTYGEGGERGTAGGLLGGGEGHHGGTLGRRGGDRAGAERLGLADEGRAGHDGGSSGGDGSHFVDLRCVQIWPERGYGPANSCNREARKAENPELVASWQDYNQMLCSDWLMKSC